VKPTLGRAVAALCVLVLSAGISVAGASTKFASTQAIDATRSLVVSFEEGSQKRFDAVDYRLDATAIAVWDLGNGQSTGVLYQPRATVTLAPDPKGRVTGTLTLDISQSGGCSCGGTLQHVEYTD